MNMLQMCSEQLIVRYIQEKVCTVFRARLKFLWYSQCEYQQLAFRLIRSCNLLYSVICRIPHTIISYSLLSQSCIHKYDTRGRIIISDHRSEIIARRATSDI